MLRNVIVAFTLCSLAACSRVDLELGADRHSSASRGERPADAPLDPRTPADLAKAIAEVEKGDPYDADEGYADVVASFQGKRYRWQLYLIPALCTDSQCNAQPFKDGGRAQGIVAGWMPRLKVTPAQRRDLLGRCGDSPQCPFTVEATLSTLTASTEKFTSLELDDVNLVAVR